MTATSSKARPTIGLVLGAGGVRGCAHAGVVSVLEEAGIPIDLVVGASVGSIFGLGVAAAVPAQQIVETVRASTALDMLRFYTGRLRSDRRNPIARMLLAAGEGKEFADLPVPFAVMATDMETGEPTALSCGPVLRAIEASIALPFIARPVAIDGRYYLDGGLLNTAPVEVARQMGADYIIAVCLGLNYTAPRVVRERPWTRPVFERIGRQRRPAGGRLHDQFRFGCRLYAATYDPLPPAQGADIAIWPTLGKLNPNSMVGAQFCLEQGIEAGRAALPEIERWMMSSRDSPQQETA
jgi:predicted acylesterase/phospholipase RssA